MAIRGIDFTVETVTALFMHGFQASRDQRTTELRPASFDGVTRYWYRALLGSSMALGEIRQRESRVFGSADMGSGVAFQVGQIGSSPGAGSEEIELGKSSMRTGKLPLLPQHAGGGSRRGGGGGRPSLSECLDPDQSFTLRLIRPRASFPEEDLLEVAWAFWAAVNLGGFGQRARRGAGSLRILEVRPVGGSTSRELPRVTPLAGDTRKLVGYLGKGLAVARSVLGISGASSTGGRPFPWLSGTLTEGPVPSIQVVDLGPEIRDEQAARACVMRRLQGYKSPMFGLPYMKTRDTQERKITGGNARHASPVWIHLHRGEDGQDAAQARYLMTVSWLPSDPLGNRRDISLDQQSRLERYLQDLKGTPVQVGGGA